MGVHNRGFTRQMLAMSQLLSETAHEKLDLKVAEPD